MSKRVLSENVRSRGCAPGESQRLQIAELVRVCCPVQYFENKTKRQNYIYQLHGLATGRTAYSVPGLGLLATALLIASTMSCAENSTFGKLVPGTGENSAQEGRDAFIDSKYAPLSSAHRHECDMGGGGGIDDGIGATAAQALPTSAKQTTMVSVLYVILTFG